MKKKFIICLMGLLLFLTACSRESSSVTDSTYIKVLLNDVEVESLTMYEGEELQLEVLSNSSALEYSSSDGESLYVEQGGYLKAKAIGTYYLTINAKKYTKKVEVIITEYVPMESLNALKDKYLIKIGNHKKIDLEIKPTNASDQSYTYEVIPFDGNVVIENGFINVLDTANKGSTYHVILTNQKSNLTCEFDVEVSKITTQIAWVIGDSIFDFRDNFAQDMVQEILTNASYDPINSNMDNIAGSTVRSASGVGIIDHINSKMYDGWNEPDIIIIQRGTNDCYYGITQPTFFTDESIEQAVIDTCKFFRERYPDVRIVWSTPIYRVDVNNEKLNWFRDLLHEACQEYGVEVFDLHLADGFNALTSENFGDLLVDGIHLNDGNGVYYMKEAWKKYLGK